MAFFKCGGGSGVLSEDLTATAGKVLAGEKYMGYDTDDDIGTGTIPIKTDSGNVTLNGSTTSKSYAAGYYPNAHGAAVSVFTW